MAQIKGKFPHVEWIDLEGKGTLTECAVMRRDDLGNTWFFSVSAIDTIDKSRLSRIISNRNAKLYELWDLMSNITLNNGINALAYFHQFVKVLTPQREILNVGMGKIGAPEPPTVPVTPAATEAPA